MYPFIYILGRQIPTYGLCMSLAILLVGTLAVAYSRKVGVGWEDILIIGAGSVLAGLACGFLLYVAVTYSLAEIWDMIKNGDFSFLWGGLVFYGALIGGVFGGLLCVRLTHTSLAAVERCVVPYIPFGHAIGRIGCLLAGCCHGAPYEGIFAVRYPNSLLGVDPNQGFFPVQPLETVINILIGACLLFLRRKERKKFELLITYLGMYAVARFFLELFRGDAIRGFAAGVSTSQWISIFLLSICIVFHLTKNVRLKKEK